jgi:hypothetical protein
MPKIGNVFEIQSMIRDSKIETRKRKLLTEKKREKKLLRKDKY